jgi:hypothetical protein
MFLIFFKSFLLPALRIAMMKNAAVALPVARLSCLDPVLQAVPIQWYRDFCSEERGMTPDVMSELLSAANFLAIEPLLDLMCLKFTFLLVGKNADEVRRSSPFWIRRGKFVSPHSPALNFWSCGWCFLLCSFSDPRAAQPSGNDWLFNEDS